MRFSAADQPERGTITLGVAFGAGAGALWASAFLAPALTADFSPLLLTTARYLIYGLVAAALVAPHWRRLRRLIGPREWLGLAWLAFSGNVLYYVLLSTAVQLGGVAMPSLMMGFLPVVVMIIGSREPGAVPLKKLAPCLLLCMAGTLCIAWQAVEISNPEAMTKRLLALGCAIGALASWSAYAVSNSRWLGRVERVSAHDWNLLTGVTTGVLSLSLVPLVLIVGPGDHAASSWLRFAGVALGVALLASILGNSLWNTMSRLLPLTLAGQMILFETLFGLLYGLILDRRMPTPLEAIAFLLVAISVATCLEVHRRHRHTALPTQHPT